MGSDSECELVCRKLKFVFVFLCLHDLDIDRGPTPLKSSLIISSFFLSLGGLQLSLVFWYLSGFSSCICGCLPIEFFPPLHPEPNKHVGPCNLRGHGVHTSNGTAILMIVIHVSPSTALITRPHPLLPSSYLLPSQCRRIAVHSSVFLTPSFFTK